MGPTALFRFMNAEGLETPTNVNALGANLWAAHKNGRVKKTSDGDYAPLDWESTDETLLASEEANKK